MASQHEQTIRAKDNQTLKYIRSLRQRSTRERERAFVVEGVRAVEDALAAGATPSLVAIREEFGWDSRTLPARVRVVRVETRIFDALAETETPQPLLAVFPIPAIPDDERGAALHVVADGVRDPGNLGTIIRSAAASGASSVRCGSGSVDPFNGKCVRAAVGAHFRISVQPLDDVWLKNFRQAAGRIVVCEASASTSYHDLDLTLPIVLVIGGEAHGVSPQMARIATDSVSIPLSRSVESLNAGVAASIVLFEAARQRRQHEKM